MAHLTSLPQPVAFNHSNSWAHGTSASASFARAASAPVLARLPPPGTATSTLSGLGGGEGPTPVTFSFAAGVGGGGFGASNAAPAKGTASTDTGNSSLAMLGRADPLQSRQVPRSSSASAAAPSSFSFSSSSSLLGVRGGALAAPGQSIAATGGSLTAAASSGTPYFSSSSLFSTRNNSNHLSLSLSRPSAAGAPPHTSYFPSSSASASVHAGLAGISLQRTMDSHRASSHAAARMAADEELAQLTAGLAALGLAGAGAGAAAGASPASTPSAARSATSNAAYASVQGPAPATLHAVELAGLAALRGGLAAAAASGPPPRTRELESLPLSIASKDVADVEAALRMSGREDEVLVSGYRVDFTRRDMRVLNPGTWLRDEAVNMWWSLLGEWRERVGLGLAYLPNSFFLSMLTNDGKGYDYSRVARWTVRAKIDIFSCDAVVLPRNISNTHWTAVYVDMRGKTIYHLDSMGDDAKGTCAAVLRWLGDEKADKGGGVLDKSEWKIAGCPRDLPRQRNGCDCGVFACAFGWYAVQGHVPTEDDFSQAHMHTFRRSVSLAILRQKADAAAGSNGR